MLLVIITRDRLDSRPRTDDAFLQADLVDLESDVSGRAALQTRSEMAKDTKQVASPDAT